MPTIQLEAFCPKGTLPERAWSYCKKSKIELAALAALTCFSACYSTPLSLLALGSYIAYKGCYPSTNELLSELHYHPSDLNLSESKPAAVKLSQELDWAKQHMQAQKSRGWFSHSFRSLSEQPCPFEIHSQEDALPSLKAGVAHAQGKRPTQEDVHIACSGKFSALSPIQYELFGIVDGHGGDDTAKFVRTHIQEEIEKAIHKHGTTDSGIRKALKEAFVQLDARIVRKLGGHSGAVAVITLKIGSCLWTANVGDSRAVLKAGNETIQLSEDAKPDTPRFKKSIEKRGGWVEVVHGVPRLNGIFALARAFGDKSFKGSGGHYLVSPRPKITKVDLKAYPGRPICLIQACDGIWDVASSIEVASIAATHSSPEKDAAAIVRAALNAGSSDNCSALVVRLS